MKKALAEIEALTAALNQIGKGIAGLMDTLDTLTKRHCAFSLFQTLIHAQGGYFPSLHKSPDSYDKKEMVGLACGEWITREQQYAELDLLALAYDMAQEARNDPRRAFRS